MPCRTACMQPSRAGQLVLELLAMHRQVWISRAPTHTVHPSILTCITHAAAWQRTMKGRQARVRWIGPAALSSSSRSATSGAVSSTAACWLAPAHALAYTSDRPHLAYEPVQPPLSPVMPELCGIQ